MTCTHAYKLQVLLEAPFDPLRRQMNSVLLTVDLTKTVADEAIERGDSVIIAYRMYSNFTMSKASNETESVDPIIFRGLKSLTLDDSQQQSLLRLAAEGISVRISHQQLNHITRSTHASGILPTYGSRRRKRRSHRLARRHCHWRAHHSARVPRERKARPRSGPRSLHFRHQARLTKRTLRRPQTANLHAPTLPFPKAPPHSQSNLHCPHPPPHPPHHPTHTWPRKRWHGPHRPLCPTPTPPLPNRADSPRRRISQGLSRGDPARKARRGNADLERWDMRR